MAKCKQCSGSGWVQDFYTLLDKPCPECNGTGAADTDPPDETPMECDE